MEIKQLKGSRTFLSPKLNIYQLEYMKKGGKWEKRRSLFYRPEFVSNNELWKAVRNGNEVVTT